MYRHVQNRILTYMKTSLMLTDAICSNMAFVAALFLVKSYGLAADEAVQTNFYPMWILFNLVATVSALHLQLYATSTIRQPENIFHATWKSVGTLLLVFIGCTLVEHQFSGVIYFFGILGGLVIFYAILSRYLLKFLLEKNWNIMKRSKSF